MNRAKPPAVQAIPSTASATIEPAGGTARGRSAAANGTTASAATPCPAAVTGSAGTPGSSRPSSSAPTAYETAAAVTSNTPTGSGRPAPNGSASTITPISPTATPTSAPARGAPRRGPTSGASSTTQTICVDTSIDASPDGTRPSPYAISRYGHTISTTANTASRPHRPDSAANDRGPATSASTTAPITSRPNTTTGAAMPASDHPMNRYEAPHTADSTSSESQERRVTTATLGRNGRQQ